FFAEATFCPAGLPFWASAFGVAVVAVDSAARAGAASSAAESRDIAMRFLISGKPPCPARTPERPQRYALGAGCVSPPRSAGRAPLHGSRKECRQHLAQTPHRAGFGQVRRPRTDARR